MEISNKSVIERAKNRLKIENEKLKENGRELDRMLEIHNDREFTTEENNEYGELLKYREEQSELCYILNTLINWICHPKAM